MPKEYCRASRAFCEPYLTLTLDFIRDLPRCLVKLAPSSVLIGDVVLMDPVPANRFVEVVARLRRIHWLEFERGDYCR